MLWYFSPTGTGRWVAKGLERAFPGLETADLTQSAARAVPPEIPSGELFTLLFPVHGHRLPGPLRCWLERLPETVIHQILSLQPPAGLQDRNHKGASFQHIHCRGSRP